MLPLKYYGFFGNIMDFSVRFPFKYYGFVGDIMDFSVRFPFKYYDLFRFGSPLNIVAASVRSLLNNMASPVRFPFKYYGYFGSIPL